MTINEITTLLNNKRKGTFLRIGWRSDNLASSAAQKLGIVVEKRTATTVRWGVDSKNTKRAKAVEAARTEPKKAWSPWYTHITETPYLVRHNTKQTTYLQLFPINRKNLTKTQWYINGEPKTKAEVEASGYVTPSKMQSATDDAVAFVIPTDRIEFIGGRT